MDLVEEAVVVDDMALGAMRGMEEEEDEYCRRANDMSGDSRTRHRRTAGEARRLLLIKLRKRKTD